MIRKHKYERPKRYYKSPSYKNCFKIYGVNYGGVQEIVWRCGKHIISKVRGYNGWVGIGIQQYCPTKYYLWRGSSENGFFIAYRHIIKVIPGSLEIS